MRSMIRGILGFLDTHGVEKENTGENKARKSKKE